MTHVEHGSVVFKLFCPTVISIQQLGDEAWREALLDDIGKLLTELGMNTYFIFCELITIPDRVLLTYRHFLIEVEKISKKTWSIYGLCSNSIYTKNILGYLFITRVKNTRNHEAIPGCGNLPRDEFADVNVPTRELPFCPELRG